MDNISYTYYQRKEPWLAALLSFFITGAGQMYCGRIGKGVGLLICAIIGWILFVIPGLAIWIYGIADAFNMAQEINDTNDMNILKQKQKSEEEESKKQAELIENERSFLKVEDFTERLIKCYKLFQNKLITENEYLTRKKSIINELLSRKISIGHDDFLYELISLKESNILTDDDIQFIKSNLR